LRITDDSVWEPLEFLHRHPLSDCPKHEREDE
jgi:hypothetical protein